MSSPTEVKWTSVEVLGSVGGAAVGENTYIFKTTTTPVSSPTPATAPAEEDTAVITVCLVLPSCPESESGKGAELFEDGTSDKGTCPGMEEAPDDPEMLEVGDKDVGFSGDGKTTGVAVTISDDPLELRQEFELDGGTALEEGRGVGNVVAVEGANVGSSDVEGLFTVALGLGKGVVTTDGRGGEGEEGIITDVGETVYAPLGSVEEDRPESAIEEVGWEGKGEQEATQLGVVVSAEDEEQEELEPRSPASTTPQMHAEVQNSTTNTIPSLLLRCRRGSIAVKHFDGFSDGTRAGEIRDCWCTFKW